MSDLPIGFISGWISDPQWVQEVVAARMERGDAVISRRADE